MPYSAINTQLFFEWHCLAHPNVFTCETGSSVEQTVSRPQSKVYTTMNIRLKRGPLEGVAAPRGVIKRERDGKARWAGRGLKGWEGGGRDGVMS